MHVMRLQAEPQAYGELGLADLLEMREECLREFGFQDVYRSSSADKPTQVFVASCLAGVAGGVPPRVRLHVPVRFQMTKGIGQTKICKLY